MNRALKYSGVKNYDAFEDQDCVSAFVEENYDDFCQDMEESGISEEEYVEHEYEWARENASRFADFAVNYQQDAFEAGAESWDE